MKKKITTYVILALVGAGVYFGYNHFFGCKSECTETCNGKDTTEVVSTPTISPDSCIVKDTTKK